jgi:hypothetical protein
MGLNEMLCVRTEEFIMEAIPKALPSNRDSQLDLQMPISIHLDHMHNVLIAAATLVFAILIVIITVSNSYQKFGVVLDKAQLLTGKSMYHGVEWFQNANTMQLR